MQNKPLLAITMGDVNGIGPEILVKALSHNGPWECCYPLVLGDIHALDQARRFSPTCPPAHPVDTTNEIDFDSKAIPVMNAGFSAPAIEAGKLDPAAGKCAAEWIIKAVHLCKDGAVQGMVTCPINKECIIKAGYPYSGHTTLIAELVNAPDYRMTLFAGNILIVHITAHLSLSQAIEAVKKERIVSTVRIARDALCRMGIPQPHIAVAGLNPHAGEAGTFGREEIEEIAPAVEQCVQEGIHCSGPYPPDTLFSKLQAGEYDVVIAMYHDQGHIPLKLVAMDEGVNVTLGIPIVRTSVDHGTAFDIAGQGIARENSLCEAIKLAAQLGTPA